MRNRTQRLISIIPAIAALLITSSSCSNDLTGSARTPDSEKLFWDVRLNYRVLNLSTARPWNQVQLVATPRNAEGRPLTGLPKVTFRAVDTLLTVTDDGLLTARGAVWQGLVIASLQVGNITHADTVMVHVVTDSSPRPLSSVKIDRAQGDTIYANQGEDYIIYPAIRRVQFNAIDADNNPMAGMLFRVNSSNRSVATTDDQGRIYIRTKGRTYVTVETTAFGVTKRDSILVVIGDPVLAFFTIQGRGVGGQPQVYFDPDTIRVAPGAIVTWTQQTMDTTRVIFDDPSAALAVPNGLIVAMVYDFPTGQSGNIDQIVRLPTQPSWMTVRVGRRFLNPGTYRFRHATYGTTGIIIVQ